MDSWPSCDWMTSRWLLVSVRGCEIMTGRLIDETPALFTNTGFVFIAQSCQGSRGQYCIAAFKFFLRDTDHRFFVFAHELVVGRYQIRRDFAAQLPDNFAKLNPQVFAPGMGKIPFGFFQLNQFGGRPVHDLLFLFGWLARF